MKHTTMSRTTFLLHAQSDSMAEGYDYAMIKGIQLKLEGKSGTHWQLYR